MPTNWEEIMPIVQYYMAGAGGAMGGEGSVAQAIGSGVQQSIAAQQKHKLNMQYMQMLKDILAGGGKINVDRDNVSIKSPANIFGSPSELAGGLQTSHVDSRVNSMVDSRVDTYNPSASPLDVSSASLVGLTAGDVTEALRSALGVEELKRKRLADIAEAGYYGTAARKMAAETAAITPSIDVGDGVKLTGKQFVDVWKAANKDERTAAKKNYDEAVEQGYKGTFMDYLTTLAKASGKGLEEVLAEFIAKREAGFKTDLAGPDFASDTKAELMKDRATWGYPPAYEELVTSGMSSDEALEQAQRELHLEAMDRKVKAVHGDDVVFKMDGWYKGGRRIARNPYYAGD